MVGTFQKYQKKEIFSKKKTFVFSLHSIFDQDKHYQNQYLLVHS